MSTKDGYISEIEYTKGYYVEFSVPRMKLALTYAGIKPPKVARGFELGVGHGLNITFNALGTGGKWFGNDFNPSHISWINDLTNSFKNISVSDHSFEELLSCEFEEPFDYICLHGIWSWVSKRNQEFILEFIKKNLKSGGAAFVSYNVSPGWHGFIPLRDLMRQKFTQSGVNASKKNVRESVNFLNKIVALDERLEKRNKIGKDRLDLIVKQPDDYIAHEFLNYDWDITNFSEVSQKLSDCKLSYAAPANLRDFINQINYSPEQIEFLNELNDPVLKKMTGDMFIGQSFRTDFWSKGAQSLNILERRKLLLEQEFILIRQRDELADTVQGHYLAAQLQKDIYDPILACLETYESKSISQLVGESKLEISEEQFFEAMIILCGNGSISPVNSKNCARDLAPDCEALNDIILNKINMGGKINFLLSPVLGAGFAINIFEGILMYGTKNGVDDLFIHLQSKLIELKENLVSNGEVISVTSENGVALLREQIKRFETRAEMYRSLQIF